MMKERKIKIFDYCWHTTYQYDMINALKNECEFYYCLTVKKDWDTSLRLTPEEVRFIPNYEKGKYDIAILHIDQQVVNTNHQKRMIFDHFNMLIDDIPKIVLNHGTPVYPEYYTHINETITLSESEEMCKKTVKKLIGDNIMVVNSKTAASEEEWGFGYPIIHGMAADEWFDLKKEPRVFTALPPFELSTYYNRELAYKLSSVLYDKYGHYLHYAKLNVDLGNSILNYKNYLGKSLLYFDPSIRTPMNRARTEAFLSGCCVIQVEGAHDLKYWAENNKNIVLVPDDINVIADTIAAFLEKKYHEAIKIGQNAKKTAMVHFCRDKFKSDWLSLLNKIIS